MSSVHNHLLETTTSRFSVKKTLHTAIMTALLGSLAVSTASQAANTTDKTTTNTVTKKTVVTSESKSLKPVTQKTKQATTQKTTQKTTDKTEKKNATSVAKAASKATSSSKTNTSPASKPTGKTTEKIAEKTKTTAKSTSQTTTASSIDNKASVTTVTTPVAPSTEVDERPSAPVVIANTTTPLAETLSSQEGKIVDGVIAVVNDNVILASQLEQATRQAIAQLRAKNQPVPSQQQLYSQVLDQMITRQVQLDLVKRQGISPEENQLNAALANIAKQNGVASFAELQRKLDAQQAGSYQALRSKISEDLAMQALQEQQVARRVKISEQDIDMFLRSPESNMLDESQYRTLHIRVPFIQSDDTKPVTDKQKQKAIKVAQSIADALQADNTNVEAAIQQAQSGYEAPIEGGDMGFHIAKDLPTELSKDIVNLSVGQVSKPLLTPQGVNVIKLVEKRGGQQQVAEQWQTRHILISPSASLTPEMAKQQIDSIYEQLRQGADFATLASTYSNDPGSASNGGLLGWVSEGEMVAPFEAMMKNTAVNDFSTPFQSQFGWHILKVEGKRQQDLSENYRRNMARQALYQRLAPQALEDWIQEIKAQSYIKVKQ